VSLLAASSPPNGRNVYLVGSSYRHHSTHSGYEGFRRYIGSSLRPPVSFRWLERGWRLDAAISSLVGKPHYSLAFLLTEAAAGLHMLRHRRALYHVIYGDTDLRFLGDIGRRLGSPVVATFHEPRAGLEWMKVDDTVTRSLAAVVLVSEYQRAYFEQLVPPEMIFVVPHGVDTSFFEPANSPGEDPVCITVGSKERDFDALSGGFDLVRRARPEARLVAIGTDVATDSPLRDTRVEYLRGVDDERLRRAYRSSRLAVFAFADATASNALLEAMACGLPIVATDVGGVREYADEDCALLCPPGDAEALGDSILRLLNDGRLAMRLGTAARRRALRFDFRHIAEQLRPVYDAAGASAG
jgi:glycosyltransferase involved in cell wall biosynthesis